MRSRQEWASQAVLLSVVCVMLCAVGSVARSDVKIVTKIESTGPPLSSFVHTRGSAGQNGPAGGDQTDKTETNAAPKTHTVTTYYKDKMARTETDTGLVTLYDAAAKKVYLVNTTLKTYSVLSLNAALKQDAQLPPLPEGTHLDTQVDLDVTGLTRAISGKDTRKYTFDGYVRTVTERPSSPFGGGGVGGGRGGGRRGGRGGGGGDPSGGGDPNGGGGGSTGSGRPIPTTQIGGEYWLADASILPAASKGLILPLLQPGFPAPPLLRAMNDRLAKLKLIPLYSQVSIREWGADSGGPVRVITTEVKSITEVTLDDALFKVPDGYQKVDPAAASRQTAQH